jgi:CBS-domain-containing membrane protein
MASYVDLPTFTLPTENRLMQPEKLPELVHLDDPALFVMIDFKRVRPSYIDANERIDNALNEMKVKGVHWLLVIDQDERVIGFIASEDILGERPIKIMQQRHIARKDILVKMVMTGAEELMAIDFTYLKHAKVAHIINTLMHAQKHYALIIEKRDPDHVDVRGLFSSSQISRQLHMDINNALMSQ